MAARSSATDGSSTTYSDRALSTRDDLRLAGVGVVRTPLMSATGSSASTSTAPVAMSTRVSRAVCAPAELVISSDWPSALKSTTSVPGVLGRDGQQRPPAAGRRRRDGTGPAVAGAARRRPRRRGP